MFNQWYIRCGATAQVVEVKADHNFEDAAVIALARALGEVDVAALGNLTVGSRVRYDYAADPDSLSIDTDVLLGRLCGAPGRRS